MKGIAFEVHTLVILKFLSPLLGQPRWIREFVGRWADYHLLR
jgi:hypothetical protein